MKPLLDLLQEQFGIHRAHLLVLVDGQASQRAILLKSTCNVVVYCLAARGELEELYEHVEPYAQAIDACLSYVATGVAPKEHVVLSSVSDLLGEQASGLISKVELGTDLKQQWGTFTTHDLLQSDKCHRGTSMAYERVD